MAALVLGIGSFMCFIVVLDIAMGCYSIRKQGEISIPSSESHDPHSGTQYPSAPLKSGGDNNNNNNCSENQQSDLLETAESTVHVHVVGDLEQ